MVKNPHQRQITQMTANQKRPLNLHEAMEDDLNIYPVQSRLYHFPDIKQLGQQFNNISDINRRLDILLKDHNLINQTNKIEKTLVTRETEGGYWFKCKVKGCQAFLKFSYTEEGKLMLARSDIEHEHKMSTRMTKGRLPKIKNSEVQECYDELQLLNFRPGEIVNFIRTRFKISRPHFYAIKYGRSKRQTIKNLLMTLSKYDHFFFQCKDLQELAAYYRNQRLKPEKRHDKDVVIVVSRKMKQLYENYHGEYVLFSVFPELVIEAKHTKKANYHHVGVLYGEDSTGAANLLFGVVFLRKSIRLAYLYVLEKLFNFLGKYPKVLITDYDQHLTQAVRRLQKKTQNHDNTIKFHLQLPNSFIINSFQSRTSSQFLSVLSNDLEGLLRQSDLKKHEIKLQAILIANQQNPIASQDRIAEQIKKFVKGNSIIYLPPVFFGLSITPYSAANLLRSRVLDFFKSPRPMVLATKAIFQIFHAYPVLKYLSKEQIEARLNPPKQCSSKKEKLQLLTILSKSYESSTKMKTVTRSLSQPAALCFHDSLQKCFAGQLLMVTSDNHTYYKVIESEQNFPYVVHHIYETKDNEQVAVWRCNCFYYAKLGLPCWHQIKACIQEKSSLIPQIHQFWLKDSSLGKAKKAVSGSMDHDVKYWNEQMTKHCFDEQQSGKLQSAHNQQDNASVSSIANGQYNVKINSHNEQEMADEDFLSEKGHDGLNDLINELNDLHSIKQNEQYDDNAWTDSFSSKASDKNSEFGGIYYEDYDKNLDFDANSVKESFNSHSQRGSNKRKDIEVNSTSKLQSLKANNHSKNNALNPLEREYKQEENFDNIDFNIDYLDDGQDDYQQFLTQSSKIGDDYQSNYDPNLSQFADNRSHTFKTSQSDGRGQMKDVHVINDDQEPFIEDDFVDNDQNSEEEWQRTSYNKIRTKLPANRIKQPHKKRQSSEEFNGDLEEDETERYVSFDKYQFERAFDE